MALGIGTLSATDKIVESYAKLVMSGKLDIESVPKKYREKVREYIENIPTN